MRSCPEREHAPGFDQKAGLRFDTEQESSCMILCYFVCFYRALSPNIYCLTGRIAGWIPQPGGNPRYEAQAEQSVAP